MTSIHATGTSTAHYPAERATVTARVSVTSRDRASSIDQATRLHNALVARAVQLRDGGDATWYAADPISTWAQKNYDQGYDSKPTIEHATSSSVRVKLSNLELVSALVEEFSQAGASTDVDWSLTEESLREREREARRAAVAEARAVAEDYADALGERIAKVVSISDTRDAPFVGGPRFAAAARMDASAPAEVTIAEITVSASVQGVFESA